MKLLQMWPAIVFGWPAIVTSIGLSVTGIVRRKPKLLAVAAILALPFSLYLLGSPLFRWFGLAIPFLLAGAGISVYHQYTRVAWLLLAPFVAVSGWLAIAVMSE